MAFATGAIAAFPVLALFAHRDLAHTIPHRASSVIVLNALPLLDVGAAPVSLLVRWENATFWVASFLVTLSYALSATLFLSLMAQRAT